MKVEDRQAIRKWEEYHKNLLKDLSVDYTESESEKILRRQKLEANPEEWFKYYFPNYATAESAPFHKRASRRVIKNKRWFEIRAWSRELAKSTRTMMEVLYLALAKKEILNTIMVSASSSNAVRLLLPYKINLERNQRIIHDYGRQKGIGNWTDEEFITRGGIAFRALGAGQSPRGTRNEAKRPDCILIDDIDTDEETRNEKRIKDKVKWIERALIPTLSVSGNYRIIVCGNIIAKVCCVTLLQDRANKVEVINIRDKHGKSTWPEKNSEADIDNFLSMLSYSARQGEFFNNPITEGTVFNQMSYKPARPLRDYRFLVCYTDPSFKDSKTADYKATVLMGRWKDEYHVIKAFCEQTSTAQMIDWHYQIDEYVDGRAAVYYYMESNMLQDTILPEFYTEGKKRGKIIAIKGDDRKKPDKFTRIEAGLEPLNSNGKLYLNSREQDNPHMKTVEEQFLAIEPGSRAHDDAPDAVEGGKVKIDQKFQQINPDALSVHNPKRRNKKRY
jgi:phage terminase large subunit-like protein